MKAKRAFIVCLAVVAFAPLASGVQYTVVNLGSLGGTSGDAYDINSDGHVVGWSSNGDHVRRPFFWSQDNNMQDLGTLPNGTIGQAFGINGHDWVVGTSENADEVWNATLWRPGQAPQDLDSLPGFPQSYATDVNNLGQVVGVVQRFTTDWERHAFLWTETDGMMDLGSLGGTCTVPNAINDSGVVVGTSESADGTSRAFVWDADNGIRDIYPNWPGRDYTANGINDGGVIVGQAEKSDGGKVPALWTNGSGEPVFADVPYGWADDVNDDGLIVGRYFETTSVQVPFAFVWDGSDSFVTLPDLVGEHAGHTVAEAINDNGWIAGYGPDSEGHTVPLLWIPEPATLSLLGLGGLALVRRKGRC